MPRSDATRRDGQATQRRQSGGSHTDRSLWFAAFLIGSGPDLARCSPDGTRAQVAAPRVRVPTLDEVPYPVKMEPNLVVEFYSR